MSQPGGGWLWAGGACCCASRAACSEGELPPPDLDQQSGDDLASEWEIVSSSISSTELEGVKELRKAVQNCDDHPACINRPYSQQAQTLLRFLRAREGNVRKAAKMFRDMLDWRHEFQVEAKVEQWLSETDADSTQRAVVCKKYAADVELCSDRFGIPVRLIRLSVGDAAGAARELGKETCLVDTLAKLEHIHAELRNAMFRHKRMIRGQLQIIDVGDYGKYGTPQWAARMWAYLKHGPELYRVLDLNYPETVRTVFFIRTGPVTNAIWRLALPLVPARTKKKLKLFGQNANEWSHLLRAELLPQEPIPAFLVSDSEEAFASAIPRGGIIPEGATGANFGDWSVNDNLPSTVAVVDSPRANASHKLWPLLLALMALIFAASLGGSVAWPVGK